jgi:hypothetical protein
MIFGNSASCASERTLHASSCGGSDTESASVDDTESDTGSGTFVQTPASLSTSGTYTEDDSYSDDTSDSETGAAAGIDFFAFSSENAQPAFSHTDSIDNTTQSSGTSTETGMAEVSNGMTTSASATSSETDSSSVSDDDDYTGSAVETYNGNIGVNDTSITGTSSLTDDYTSDSSYSSTGTYVAGLDEAGKPSTSSNVTFSDSQTTGNTLDENSSASSSATTVEGDETSHDDGDSDVDQNTQGSTSYQQTGTYSTVTDDGLTVSDPDIDTTQSDNVTSYNTSQGGSHYSQYPGGNFNLNVSGGKNVTTNVASQKYQGQDQETAAGHSGSNSSVSDTEFNVSRTNSSTFTTNPPDGGFTTGWTFDNKKTSATYGPDGGEQEGDEDTGIGGETFDEAYGDSNPPPVSYSLDTPSSGPYNTGGASQVSLDLDQVTLAAFTALPPGGGAQGTAPVVPSVAGPATPSDAIPAIHALGQQDPALRAELDNSLARADAGEGNALVLCAAEMVPSGRGTQNGVKGDYYSPQYYTPGYFVNTVTGYGPPVFVPDPLPGIQDPGGMGHLRAGMPTRGQANFRQVQNGVVIAGKVAEAVVVIATVVIPGPEDVAVAVAAKAGYRLVNLGGRWAITLGGKLLKGADEARAVQKIHDLLFVEKAVAGSTKLSAAEKATAARLEQKLGRRLIESEHVGADFIDEAGIAYDAMGYPGGAWNAADFTAQIGKHLNKSGATVVLDMTGYSAGQIAEVTSYLNSLSSELRSRIITIGF